MNTPLPILRRRADDALQSFTAHSGHEPEEVWQGLLNSTEIPELLTESLGGEHLWQQFSTLRLAEINILKNLRQN